jgi:hypothetical protein
MSVDRRSFLATALVAAPVLGMEPRWSEQQAWAWYKKQPWLVGCNYAPAYAINQLEMWQPEAFDEKAIDRELALAEGIGFNTIRVFLHDLLWKADAAGFTKRIDRFLALCAKHKIRPMFVLFDSVWDPNPKLGEQRAPKKGVHNSGWVQSPGADILKDPAKFVQLAGYVEGVVKAFAKDSRVLAWDLWNEPDNGNGNSYKALEVPEKPQIAAKWMAEVFEWARTAKPTQPLTVGLWQGKDWSSDAALSPVDQEIVRASDVISFHNYNAAPEFEKRIVALQRLKRPLLCTEYMARGAGSTFEGSLPVAAKHGVAAYNWGFVQGKTQTDLPWDSWQKPYVDREPSIWFHEVFRADGKPYKQDEVDLIRRITAETRRKPVK